MRGPAVYWPKVDHPYPVWGTRHECFLANSASGTDTGRNAPAHQPDGAMEAGISGDRGAVSSHRGELASAHPATLARLLALRVWAGSSPNCSR